MARVTVLLGKGGTGRTTLARALALDHAERGSSILLHADPTTEVPARHVENLQVRVLDPYQFIEDAMARLVPLGPLTRTLVRHPAYESFLEVAPGIKEAAVINFVHGLLERRPGHIFLDGPATGHGLHFLEAPGKLEDVLAGKLAARMARLDEMLHDPETVEVLLVALPEELPTLEVCELADRLDQQGFPLRGVLVNRVPPPVPFETDAAPAVLAPPVNGRGGWGLEPDQALALLAAQRAEAEAWLEELEDLGLPLKRVPSLPGRGDLAEAARPFVEGWS